MINLLLFLFLSLLIQQSYAQHFIIPEPVSYKSNNDEFVFNKQIILAFEADDKQLNQYINHFTDFLNRVGAKVKIKKIDDLKKIANPIIITLNRNYEPELGEEGYTLNVNDKSIILSANLAAGIFYGLQTLRQLFPPEFESPDYQCTESVKIKGCKIKDYPRFSWRGLMLDVSRHFFTVDEVKMFIDKMAQYKFNVFHWHLSDDEGWRIEIKSLPKLTEVGAWRVERHGRFGKDRPYPQQGEKATYGGFYTQEQIREVVNYANSRNITIVPEIDMPGHSMAALAAYPELSTMKEPKFVNPGSYFAEWYEDDSFKMFIENTLNPADGKVYDFVDMVFTEVAELFPGQYIHMGGDECYHGYWEADTLTQIFMSDNRLKNSHELQAYFVRRVQKIIESKGKKMIGWDEILDGELTEGAAVMSWHGMNTGIAAANKGYEVVLSPTTHVYLDYTQGDHSLENPIYNDLSLEKCYSFEPLPEEVDPKFILGGQGNLWTEVIPNLQYAFYMTYPRAFAISETVWSPKENKDWQSFINRTEMHFSRFDLAEINISKAVLDPIITVYLENEQLMCELKNSVPESEIYYTIDNTYPVQFGNKYDSPFIVPAGDLSLRTQTFRNDQPIGRELLIHRTELEKRTQK